MQSVQSAAPVSLLVLTFRPHNVGAQLATGTRRTPARRLKVATLVDRSLAGISSHFLSPMLVSDDNVPQRAKHAL